MFWPFFAIFVTMSTAGFIIKLTDRLYVAPFNRLIPRQTFRYALCGGANMGLDMVLYFLFFHFLYEKSLLDLGFVVISPQIASFLTVFPITLFTGLWLAKNVSFRNSPLKDRTQCFRYLLVVCINIATKYLGLKLLTEVLAVFPSIANAIMTVVTVIISYLLQKHFSFRGNSGD